MESRLKKLLTEYHLQLKYLPLHKKGCFIKTKGSLPDQIIVNSYLPDEEIEKVILHEVGHAKNDCNCVGNYRKDYSANLQSEFGANNFMIHEQVKKYIALGNDAANSNWLNLAKSIGTQNYWLVREELLKYRIN